jgi:hypothetical protein
MTDSQTNPVPNTDERKKLADKLRRAIFDGTVPGDTDEFCYRAADIILANYQPLPQQAESKTPEIGGNRTSAESTPKKFFGVVDNHVRHMSNMDCTPLDSGELREKLEADVRGINIGREYGYNNPLMHLVDERVIRVIADFVDSYAQAKVEEAKEVALHVEVMYLSDIARAVGLLQGLGHPDEYLEKRLAQLKASHKQEKLGNVHGADIVTDEKLPADCIRFDHPDGRSEGFAFKQEKHE